MYDKSLFSVLKLLIAISVVNCHPTYDNDAVAKAFSEHQVVPDVIAVPPKQELKVRYNDQEVKFGNELTPTQVKDMPSVEWEADSDAYYTIIMVDPDVLSRNVKILSEWHHWIVVNIPGNDVSKGEVIFDYVGSGPPENTGLHRYVLLVFKQQHKQDFDEPRLTKKVGQGREQRSVKKFAEKYALGDPVAGNFFQAKYNDYVPILYEQLCD